MQKLIPFIICLITLSTPATFAYLDLNESGELINQGEQRVGFTPQFVLNRGGGTNASLFVEAGTSESTSTRVTLEGGDVSFNAFVSMKYIPFPDVDQQPAMGLRGGIGIARDGDNNNLYFQVAPIASKMVDSDFGTLIPYVSIPFEFNSTKSDNFMSNRFVVGSELRTEETPSLRYGSELGLEMNKSFSYISFYISFALESGKSY